MHDCQYCRIFNKDWHKLHMYVDYTSVKEYLGNELLQKRGIIFDVALAEICGKKDYVKNYSDQAK